MDALVERETVSERVLERVPDGVTDTDRVLVEENVRDDESDGDVVVVTLADAVPLAETVLDFVMTGVSEEVSEHDTVSESLKESLADMDCDKEMDSETWNVTDTFVVTDADAVTERLIDMEKEDETVPVSEALSDSEFDGLND
jgi:hypothetical protein